MCDGLHKIHKGTVSLYSLSITKNSNPSLYGTHKMAEKLHTSAHELVYAVAY